MNRYSNVVIARHELTVLTAYRSLRKAVPRNRRERITKITLIKLINAAGRIDRAERARVRAQRQCAA